MAQQIFHVRWSSIKTFRNCQKRYEYSWVQMLQRRRPILPLIRGTMIGQCLDQLADGKKFMPVLDKYTKEYNKLFSEEKEEYGDVIGEVRRIVNNYKVLYHRDGLTYLKDKDSGLPYEIQVQTEFMIGRLKVRFSGHIDKYVQDGDGHRLVLDHKSHKAIPMVDARYNDLQLLTYVWLLPQSGYDAPHGVLWDYLRTKPPTIPEILKSGELTKRANLDSDYKTYMQAIKDNGLDPDNYKEVLDRFKAEGGNRYFERVKLPKPPKAMIDSVVNDFKQTIIQIQDATKRGHFVRDMSRDCKGCEFYELCQAEIRGLDASYIRKANYKEREIA
jgi:hypothetical protein